MSVFENSSNQEEGADEPKFLELVQKARGENWSDPEVLAKGYIESQKHIEDIEAKLAELGKNAEQKDWAEAILSKLEQRHPASTGNAPVEAGTTETATPAQPSEDDLKSLINATLTEKEKESTAKQNRDTVDDGLRTLYGTEAENKLVETSKKIGMSVKRLQAIAEESPSAFFQLIGEAPKKETNSVTTNTVNTQGGFNTSSKKNWAYFQNLRRTDPKLYKTPAIQNEILAERKGQGDAFYS